MPSHSVVSDSVTPWTAVRQASLSFTISQSLLKLMSLSQWWDYEDKWNRIILGTQKHNENQLYFLFILLLAPWSSTTGKLDWFGWISRVSRARSRVAQGREDMLKRGKDEHVSKGREREVQGQVLSCFSHVRLYDPMDCSPPGSSVHGILQAKILEWVAIPFSNIHQ